MCVPEGRGGSRGIILYFASSSTWIPDIEGEMFHRAESKLSHPSLGLRLQRRSKGGFTLVEMMVAIFVLGLVLTAAFSTVAQALQTVETSRDYARVAQILQSEMEDLRTMSWATLEAQEETDGGVVAIDLTEEFNEAFGSRYRAFRRIQNRTDGTVTYANQKEATIWVYWWDARGNFRIKQTVSWFTENGLHDYYYRSF